MKVKTLAQYYIYVYIQMMRKLTQSVFLGQLHGIELVRFPKGLDPMV
jgi:hypothetical protein